MIVYDQIADFPGQYRIPIGATAGAFINALYDSRSKYSGYLTREEMEQKRMVDAIRGAILGAGIAAVPDLIKMPF